ncbi:MAG: large conductance mechanosensitive channel protein MscL [Chryseolinea sp.]
MLKEFKEFAIRGNVVDLAIAVIIGGAFGKIVNSLIDDVITPLILKPALEAAHLTKLEELTVFGTVKYGSFLAAVINFMIVAFVLFLIIKGLNSFKKKEEAAPILPPADIILLTEIRDVLKKRP